MRVWDVPPALLCRQHLLGEHRELHGLWRILVLNKLGYSRHPETLRWVGKQGALYHRHEALVAEMTRRGYNHATPLDAALAIGDQDQTTYVDAPARQIALLRAKGCACLVESPTALAIEAAGDPLPPAGASPAAAGTALPAGETPPAGVALTAGGGSRSGAALPGEDVTAISAPPRTGNHADGDDVPTGAVESAASDGSGATDVPPATDSPA